MATDEDGLALFAQAPQQIAHLDNAERVETIGWLVEDQKVGIRKECHGPPQPLLHPQRVLPNQVLRAIAQSDDFKHLAETRSGVTAKLGQHLQVFAPAQAWIESWRLDEHPN